MTISIWRYSHLVLALVSGLFLVLASLTGIILAFAPMQSALKPYQPADLSAISLAHTVGVLQNNFDEVLSITLDADNFLLAEVVTHTGDSRSVYVHPQTAGILGEPQPQHPIFQFTTTLHRSLFLKGIGRFFVGMVSFLLCLIAITGLMLIIKRQGGLHKLFAKVQDDNFLMRYHVVLGRWFLVPIIILAATGVYLSAEKFGLLPTTKLTHPMVIPAAEVDMSITPAELPLFQRLTLAELRTITFPFSEFPEDYFEVSLTDRELYVHQYTGEILSEQAYPFTFFAKKWSMLLHTGQGSLAWSIVLLLASLAILFFTYSGIVLWRKRAKNSGLRFAKPDKDACSHVILVGSETGTTYAFAKSLEQGLLQLGHTVLVSQINAYTTYAKAEQLIFLAATYGEGEAPNNAQHIAKLLTSVTPARPLQYCVVGFGSKSYPKYCEFAVALDQWLAHTPQLNAVLPLHKINNRSFTAFTAWATTWATATKTPLQLGSLPNIAAKQHGFKVTAISPQNEDDTFMLQLKPLKKTAFHSGDLWAFKPDAQSHARLYSVAKIDKEVVLSIKRHQNGLASNRLAKLRVGDKLRAAIQKNTDFHFPKKATEVVCIANGTGIAPFLGFIAENKKRLPLQLYWGARQHTAIGLYQDIITAGLQTKQLTSFNLALSQAGSQKVYVQDLLLKDKATIAQKLAGGSVFMLCGSLAMQKGVFAALAEITEEMLQKPLSFFEEKGQIKTDCY